MSTTAAKAPPPGPKTIAPARSTTARTAMIEADNLSKFYGDFAACRDVTFTVTQGEVAAFLGPNGAGKSTTMKLITGYLAPSAGTARIATVRPDNLISSNPYFSSSGTRSSKTAACAGVRSKVSGTSICCESVRRSASRARYLSKSTRSCATC